MRRMQSYLIKLYWVTQWLCQRKDTAVSIGTRKVTRIPNAKSTRKPRRMIHWVQLVVVLVDNVAAVKVVALGMVMGGNITTVDMMGILRRNITEHMVTGNIGIKTWKCS